MGRHVDTALPDLVGTGQNVAVNVEALEESDVWVGGTFVATYTVEASPDGVLFVPVPNGAGLTAPAIVSLPSGTKQTRVDCTAFTSGTIESVAAGRDLDRLG